MQSESPLEATLALQIRALKLPEPTRQYKFLPDRKFQADFCWPDRMLIVECQGAVHRIKARFHDDLERQALALLAGWKVLCVGREQIYGGQAIQWIEQLLLGSDNVRKIYLQAHPEAQAR